MRIRTTCGTERNRSRPMYRAIPTNAPARTAARATRRQRRPVDAGLGAAGRFREVELERVRGTAQQVVSAVRQAYFDALLAAENLRILLEMPHHPPEVLQASRGSDGSEAQQPVDQHQRDDGPPCASVTLGSTHGHDLPPFSSPPITLDTILDPDGSGLIPNSLRLVVDRPGRTVRGWAKPTHERRLTDGEVEPA